jgi:hypothetical protein
MLHVAEVVIIRVVIVGEIEVVVRIPFHRPRLRQFDPIAAVLEAVDSTAVPVCVKLVLPAEMVVPVMVRNYAASVMRMDFASLIPLVALPLFPLSLIISAPFILRAFLLLSGIGSLLLFLCLGILARAFLFPLCLFLLLLLSLALLHLAGTSFLLSSLLLLPGSFLLLSLSFALLRFARLGLLLGSLLLLFGSFLLLFLSLLLLRFALPAFLLGFLLFLSRPFLVLFLLFLLGVLPLLGFLSRIREIGRRDQKA